MAKPDLDELLVRCEPRESGSGNLHARETCMARGDAG